MKRRRHCTKQASLSAMGCFPSSPGFSVGRCTRTDPECLFFYTSPRAKGMGKKEKNPLRAVRAPGHTGYDSFVCKRGHFGIVMPSARDCPMGVFFIRHLGIGGHVKFAVRIETSRGVREARGAHQIDDV
ncbi:hypothetical protein EVAR_36543_1 [Eumeta japonica]|uniref:Uncharacterized protein n=1 Tax=Eumeta variegata TaxID=151549 RepID=A0A4C1ZBC7_EUMVA|nr:hypothetical protein EVAR_36543_1 [Eumeta japonica]